MTDRTDRFYASIAAATDAYLAVGPAQLESLGRLLTSYGSVPLDVHQVLARVASALAIDPQCFYEVVWVRAQGMSRSLGRAQGALDEIMDSGRGVLSWRADDLAASASFDRRLIADLLRRINRARFAINPAAEEVDGAAVADASSAALDLARLTARPTTPMPIQDGLERVRSIIRLLEEVDVARLAVVSVDGEVLAADPRTMALAWVLDVADSRVRAWLLPDNQQDSRALEELTAEMASLHGVLEMLRIQPAATGLLVHPFCRLDILRDGVFMEVEGVATPPLIGGRPSTFLATADSPTTAVLSPSPRDYAPEESWFSQVVAVRPHRNLAVFADVIEAETWSLPVGGTVVTIQSQRDQPKTATFAGAGTSWEVTAVAPSPWAGHPDDFVYLVVDDLGIVVVLEVASDQLTGVFDPQTGTVSVPALAALQAGSFPVYRLGSSDTGTGPPTTPLSLVTGISFSGRLPAAIREFAGKAATVNVTLPGGLGTAGALWTLPADPTVDAWTTSGGPGAFPDGAAFALSSPLNAVIQVAGRVATVTRRGWEQSSASLAVGQTVFFDEYAEGSRITAVLPTSSSGSAYLLETAIPLDAPRLMMSRGGDGYLATVTGGADVCANDTLVVDESRANGTVRVINAAGPEIVTVPDVGPVDGEEVECARFRHIGPGDLLAWAQETSPGAVTGRGRVQTLRANGSILVDVLEGEPPAGPVVVWFYATPQTQDYTLYETAGAQRRRVTVAAIERRLRSTFLAAAMRRGLAPTWSVTSAGRSFPHEVLRDDRLRLPTLRSVPGQSLPLQLRFSLGVASDAAILTALEDVTTNTGDTDERTLFPLDSCQITQVLESSDTAVGTRMTLVGADPVPEPGVPVTTTVRGPRPVSIEGPVTFGGHTLYPFFAFAQYRLARAENPVVLEELEQDAISATVDRGATTQPLTAASPTILVSSQSRQQVVVSSPAAASLFVGAEVVLPMQPAGSYVARIRQAQPAGEGLVSLQFAEDVPAPDAPSGQAGVDLASLEGIEDILIVRTSTLTPLWRELVVARKWVTDLQNWLSAVRPPRSSYFADAAADLASRGRADMSAAMAKADVSVVLDPFKRQSGDFERSVADRLQSVVESLQSARVSPLTAPDE
jgi:hypothetical protein